MKLSISLSADEVAVIDDHVRHAGLRSRSAAVQRAIQLLRHADLEQDYEAAWAEWDGSPDREAWEATGTDGLA